MNKLNKIQQNQNIDLFKKKFYFSDWLAKVLIKTIAFVSFLAIVLIFLFVFREALPIFSYQAPTTTYTEEELEQETYGEENISVKTPEKLSSKS